jgi:hypothetical protein
VPPLLHFAAVVLATTFARVPTDGSGLTLDGQRGELDVSGKQPRLRFSVLAKNKLPVAIERIRVGVIYAEDGEILRKLDAAQVYKNKDQGGTAYGVVDQEVAAVVGAGGEVEVHLEVPVREGGPSPRSFVTYVLGYTLGAVHAPVLLDLLGTDAASDELAAVTALALTGAPFEQLAVRQRLHERQDLLIDFVAEVTRTVPERPSERDTLRRVFAVRALGVLGGADARAALARLREESTLSRFDEPLQVLRIARLVGSRLETPLAFAVPAAANTMADLVGTAMADVDELAKAPAKTETDSEPPPAEQVPDAPAALDTAAVIEPRPSTALLPALATAVLTFGLVAAGLLVWQRRRSNP